MNGEEYQEAKSEGFREARSSGCIEVIRWVFIGTALYIPGAVYLIDNAAVTISIIACVTVCDIGGFAYIYWHRPDRQSAPVEHQPREKLGKVVVNPTIQADGTVEFRQS